MSKLIDRHRGRQRRILLDLSTSLQWRGRHAVGIVRTEREIARRLLSDADIDVLPVIFHAGRFFALDPKDAFDLITVGDENPTPIVEVAPEKKPATKHTPLRVLGSLARLCARTALRSVPLRAREEFRQTLLHGRETIRRIIYGSEHMAALPPSPVREAQIDLRFIVYPTPNDVLFLGGLGWDVIDCTRVTVLKREYGMKVACIMYDLIPTKMPQFLGGTPKDYFRNYFLHMADLCDHIFCISKTTLADLKEFCESHERACPPASVVYLGAEMPATPDASGVEPAEVRERLRGGRFALAVGTFEVRKNYAFLLSIWEEMLEDPTFDLDLVIAGMPGWGVDEVIKKMERSPHYGKRIFWFKRLSDGGISWLYEKCQVFVFPSLYEGWGLPVIEALQHGKPVISSDRGSVPEAGLGVTTVLDLDRPEDWKKEIRTHAKNSCNPVVDVSLPSWEDAARAVKTTLVALQ